MSLSLLFVYYLKSHLLSNIVDILCLFTFLCILEINYHCLGPPKHISILCNLKETTTSGVCWRPCMQYIQVLS